MTDRYPIPRFPHSPIEVTRERPILFSASMVRALLAGTKTQTRRELKMQPLDVIPCDGEKAGIEWVGRMEADPPRGVIFACKFGRPGDRLWVREAFIHEPADYCWEASVSIPSRPAVTTYRADFEGDTKGDGWKPSIHMPRSLSRILLEITEVRVERLNDISDADAIAEGITTIWPDGPRPDKGPNHYTFKIDSVSYNAPTAREAYARLWEMINGPGSWDKNPWVWVISFLRIKP